MITILESKTLNKIKKFIKDNKGKIFTGLGLTLAGAGAVGYANYNLDRQKKRINELKSELYDLKYNILKNNPYYKRKQMNDTLKFILGKK